MADEAPNGAQFEEFLAYLSTSRNFDFTAYKRGSLMRRIDKRMQAVRIASYADYQDYLEVHPEEFTELFNTILINVTSFFRDQPAWDFLAREVLPGLLSEKHPGEPVRVWSAGCASGEEAYSIAMLLCEAMGIEEYRERVKIYATDVDEDALNTARQATYSPKALGDVPEEMREKYFEPSNGDFSFRKDLRRTVIFGRHDLLRDAPISRVDLLICRNTLMYLNAESQRRVFSRFFFALADGGVLFLGKAETMLTQTSALVPMDLKLRIFSKARSSRELQTAAPGAAESMPVDGAASVARAHELAFEMDAVAQVIIDAGGALAAINHRARQMFGVPITEVGRRLQDLEMSYRPVELRSLIEEAYREGRSVILREQEWRAGGRQGWVDVEVIPLFDTGKLAHGVKIEFEDVTRFKELERALQQSKNELETAYEELQSTNEELETTNEELQSTIEELETTNEELQSTNEELETMNEELQSTNEELETVNKEMQDRSRDLNDANAFLASVLKSLRAGVAVINRDLSIQAWNTRAEDLWGVRSDEVQGRHFLNLDIGLPIDNLRQAIRDCLSGSLPHVEVELPATNRRGKPISCKVTCTPLHGADGSVDGVILLMDEVTAP